MGDTLEIVLFFAGVASSRNSLTVPMLRGAWYDQPPFLGGVEVLHPVHPARTTKLQQLEPN